MLRHPRHRHGNSVAERADAVPAQRVLNNKRKGTRLGVHSTSTLNSNYRHGHATGGRSSTYMIWQQLVQRCTNPKHARYHRYGGRGVTVCDQWLTFPQFLADMGERPTGLSLERIDNNKGYSPDNCEWATRAAQAANTSQVRLLTAHGLTLHLSEWARRMGITTDVLWKRLKRRGDRPIEDVLR